VILAWSESAWQDYLRWQREDKKTVQRIHRLIEDILRNGYEGIGKPEPLSYQWAGYWSRRIDQEHRLVYRVDDDMILIAACRYHYTR
jgi:toxin YoeB